MFVRCHTSTKHTGLFRFNVAEHNESYTGFILGIPICTKENKTSKLDVEAPTAELDASNDDVATLNGSTESANETLTGNVTDVRDKDSGISDETSVENLNDTSQIPPTTNDTDSAVIQDSEDISNETSAENITEPATEALTENATDVQEAEGSEIPATMNDTAPTTENSTLQDISNETSAENITEPATEPLIDNATDVKEENLSVTSGESSNDTVVAENSRNDVATATNNTNETVSAAANSGAATMDICTLQHTSGQKACNDAKYCAQPNMCESCIYNELLDLCHFADPCTIGYDQIDGIGEEFCSNPDKCRVPVSCYICAYDSVADTCTVDASKA